MAELSVVICTRNPRTDYLSRVISALRGQTLDSHRWDLLIVDNCSHEPLGPKGLIDWHPRGRLVREETCGITFARLLAIEETSTPLLLFVDDDNVLSSDYLEEALRIATLHPDLGAYGAGVIAPDFEDAPARLPRIVREHLTLRHHRRSIVSRAKSPRNCPSGAGMIVRRRVADRYLQKCRQGQATLATLFQRLGIPSSSPGANDFDLGYQAADFEMSMGVFPSLKLTHLIESRRTTDEYLLGHLRNNARAMALLAYTYNDERLPRHRVPWGHPIMHFIFRLIGREREFAFQREWWSGEVDAYRLLQKHQW